MKSIKSMKSISLSIRWKILILISAIFIILGIEWQWQFLNIMKAHQENLEQQYTQQYQAIAEKTLTKNLGSLENIALWAASFTQNDLPPYYKELIEAELITHEVIAIAQKKPHQITLLYQEPHQLPFNLQTYYTPTDTITLSCQQKQCFILSNINSYSLQGNPVHLIIAQRASIWFDQIRQFIDPQNTLFVLTTEQNQQLTPLISTNPLLLKTLWPHLFSTQNIKLLTPIQQHQYLSLPIKMNISSKTLPHLKLWVIQNIDQEFQTWQAIEKRGMIQFALSWVALIALLLLFLRRWLKSLNKIETALHFAGQKRFKEGADYLRWTKRPPRIDELHRLHLFSRKMLLRMGRITHQLEWMAFHDTLTGLPNRRNFYHALNRITQQRQGALIFLDLNHFKQINDVYGHKIGDAVLIDLATRLSQLQIPYPFKAFRLAGDEFTLIIFQQLTPQALRALLSQLAHQLSGTLTTPQKETIYYHASLGAVLIDPNLGDYTASKLLHWADIAMYKAKHESSTLRWSLFNPETDDDTQAQKEELKLVSWMRHALNQPQGFQLVAQPIVNINQNTVQRYEILLRLNDLQNQSISPAIFIPIAERHGLIYEIDLWVFEHAIKALKHTHPMTRFSINLSAPSLQRPDLAQTLLNIAETYQVPHQQIVVELTETAYIQNLTQVKSNLTTLKNAGIQLALDDFGVGYTSFSYLTDLGFDYIKLDGNYIKDLNENKVHYAFVKGVTEIVQALEMQVIAEFVENADILKTLKDLNVDYAQGWHTGKPQPIETLFTPPKNNSTESP